MCDFVACAILFVDRPEPRAMEGKKGGISEGGCHVPCRALCCYVGVTDIKVRRRPMAGWACEPRCAACDVILNSHWIFDLYKLVDYGISAIGSV